MKTNVHIKTRIEREAFSELPEAKKSDVVS
jgi:hypothetical protein